MPVATDPYELLAQKFEPKPDYQNDPALWVEKRAGEELWSVQRQIMTAICTERMVAVPSCHEVGKSHIASRIAAWWIDVWGQEDPGEVFLVTTAPTNSQVALVLWRYIRQLHRKAELPGRINRAPYPQWVVAGEEVGIGRKPADYDESVFQGFHATKLLVIVDEACGIQVGLWDQLASLVANIGGRILAIGNPTDPATFFFQICKPGSDWKVIWVDALHTPNFSDEGTRDYPLTRLLMEAEGIPFATEQISDTLAEKLVSPLYVEERIRLYCGFTKDSHREYEQEELKVELVKRTGQSAMFLARVRGIFPTKASEGIIPLGWVMLAVQRWHDWNDGGQPEPPGRRVLGVDVADQGEDETVVAQRQGHVVQELRTYHKQDTVETTDVVHPYLDRPGAIAVVDVNGIGAGVYHQLNRRHHDAGMNGAPSLQGVAVPFNASAKSPRRDITSGEFKFLNDRAAAWWRMRELLDPSRGSNICLPDDELLIEELTSVHSKTRTGGIIQVESKDDIKKKLRRSTDRADAVIQSFWMEGAVLDYDETLAVGSRTKHGVVGYEGYESFTWDDIAGDAPGSGGWET